MSGPRNLFSLPFEKFSDLKGPIIDIRSPKEFMKGHWPGSKNIPLFNDEERAKIGITYKNDGQKEAIKTGINLVIPKLSQIKTALELVYEREKIENNLRTNQSLRIYCWRGGMRSKSLVWLSNKLGIKAFQLKGGYKTYRKWVLSQFGKEWPIYLLGGKTGTGKTKLLKFLSNKNISTIDLEGLANHRGSSFGGLGLPTQPTNEQYENLISESLANLKNKDKKAIWLEDESPNLGNCRIPRELIEQMRKAPVLEIKKSQEERIKELVNIYSKYPVEQIQQAIFRIQKRLGPQRTNQAMEATSKKDWESACSAMLDYYDRCYEFQLKKVKQLKTIDLSGMDNEIAADFLIENGYVY